MKKATLFYLLSLFLVGLFFETSCKKYPNGPLLSLHSKEHRIVGTWIVDYYSINGYDSTSYLQGQPYYGKCVFYKQKGDYSADFVLVSNDNNYFSSGSWWFTDNKKDLKIQQSTFQQFYMNPYIAGLITWEIRRLTVSDLWLKTTYNGKEYFMKLKH